MTKRILDPQERLGQIITAIIAVIHLLLPAIRLILDFELGSLLTFLISAILSVALFSGIDWVRYLFITGAALTAMASLHQLLVGIEFAAGSYWLIPLFVLQIAYSVTACLLLLFSKAVKEFLYRQKNG